MGLFYKNKGTISVFLSLILLPVILVAGLTVDASRIYLAKVVISDAGEMAMNAGLAQYNEELHDEYGLLVMEESPMAMSGELEGYFDISLSGSGLPDEGEYRRILDLMSESFEAVNVAGSEIYRTEVEKQQIIEYMKYRAPVCLTELVLDKFDMLKDTKKMTEAMEAQLDFSQAMEDCQDAFEDAMESLEALSAAIESFPSDDTVSQELENTKEDYTGTMSLALLMREAGDEISREYDRNADRDDLREMAEAYIAAAKKVDLSAPVSSVTFNAYVEAVYYANTVSELGGIDCLLTDYDEKKEEEEARESQEGDGEQSQGTDDRERQELEKIVNDYKTQSGQGHISAYLDTLTSTARNIINNHFNTLNGWRTAADNAESLAERAYDRLETVEKKLEEAEEKFNSWSEKYSELEGVGKAGDMGSEIDGYRDFFSTGEGSTDVRNLQNLMSAVNMNKNFFREFREAMTDETFFGESVVSSTPSSQFSTYESNARDAVSGIDPDYDSVNRVRESYAGNYNHITISTSSRKISIKDDTFYKKLQEYCKEGVGKGSPEEQDKANETLRESDNAAAEAAKTDGYPTFNWSEAGVRLPSSEAGVFVRDAAGAADMALDANVADSGARDSVISEFKESISAATSFLDCVDQIVADGLENLYIAEYAMQMFSYYTVNKTSDGQEKPVQDIISLSGYDLTGRPAYQAEVEYILWGDQLSQNNVGNTIAMIFGIRMLFNSFFAFTNATINGIAHSAASLIAAGAPYLIPIIKAVIKLGYAGVETADDMIKIKQGQGVTIFKDESTWTTLGGNNTEKVTFDYSEYLRVFLNVSILAGHKVDILSRIADCIQVDKNQEDEKEKVDLINSYTMIQVEAKVKVRTTFMRKWSDFGSGGWGFPDDTYTVLYQSILGY